MKIETRLNKGDRIFFLHDKRVVTSNVQKIKIEISDNIEILYLCNSEADKNVNIKVEEQFAFKSKEELLKSL